MKTKNLSARNLNNPEKVAGKNATVISAKEAGCEKTASLAPKAPAKLEKKTELPKKVLTKPGAAIQEDIFKSGRGSNTDNIFLGELSRGDARTSQPEPKIPLGANNKLLDEVKKFENAYSLLLQFGFMISQIKNDWREQEEYMKKQMHNRLQSLLDLRSENKEKEIELVTKQAICELEAILDIENPTHDSILDSVQNFSKYYKIVETYMKSSLRKIYLGEGVLLDFEEMNEFIKISDDLMKNIIEKHKDFLSLNEELRTLVDQFLWQSQEEAGLIREILEIWRENEDKIIDNLAETAKLKQEERLKLGLKKLQGDV